MDFLGALKKYEGQLKRQYARLDAREKERAASASKRATKMTAKDRALAILNKSKIKLTERGVSALSNKQFMSLNKRAGQKRPRTIPVPRIGAGGASLKSSTLKSPLMKSPTMRSPGRIAKKQIKSRVTNGQQPSSSSGADRKVPRSGVREKSMITKMHKRGKISKDGNQETGPGSDMRGRGRGRGGGKDGRGRGKRLRLEEMYPEVNYQRNKFGYQVLQHIDANEKPDEQFPLGEIKDVETRKRIHATNYHLRQNQEDDLCIKTMEAKHRLLYDSFPRRRYRRRNNEFKSVNHWNQRQVVVQEIEFLTKYAREGDFVVYIGAAPATQIPYLAELFPMVEFHLYDDRPEDFRIDPGGRIHVHIDDPLTKDVQRDWQRDSPRLLLISKLKNSEGAAKAGANQLEEFMVRQRDIFKTMEPRKALLRFGLPWGKGESRYLEGEIYLPVWGKQTTAEALLVPGEEGRETVYDHNEFEEKMFYFNTVHRVQYYRHLIDDVRGVDHCFDCATEVFVLGEYLKVYYNTFVEQYERIENNAAPPAPIEGTPSREQMKEKAGKFMLQLCKVCSANSDRELHYNPPPAIVRARWFYNHNVPLEEKTVKTKGSSKLGKTEYKSEKTIGTLPPPLPSEKPKSQGDSDKRKPESH